MTTIIDTRKRPLVADTVNASDSENAYNESSATVITDALRKGFDVLQMPEGDIFATGNETVVYHYHWDEKLGQFVRKKITHSLPEPATGK